MGRLDNEIKKNFISIFMKNEIVIERSIYRSFPRMPDREVDHAYSRNTD